MRGPVVAVVVLAAVFGGAAAIFLAVASNNGEAEEPSGGAAATTERTPPPRRAAAGAETRPAVEIDDAPLPADATLTIRGCVRDRAGTPIADARVSVDPDDGEGRERATTGADGAYVVEGLDAATTWRVHAWAEEHAPSAEARAVFATAARLERRIDFVLDRLGSIDVVVLDERGAPLRHETSVYVLDTHERSPTSSGGLAPGRYRVVVGAAGFADQFRDIDVVGAAPTRAEFRLEQGVEVGGVLVADDGSPMEGYEIVASPADGVSRGLRRTKTARDGSFAFRGLRRARYDVHLVAFGPAAVDLATDGGDGVLAPNSDVRLQVRPAATATFHLVYPPDLDESDRHADARVSVLLRTRDLGVSPRWEYDRATVRVPGGVEVEILIDAPGCVRARRSVTARSGDVVDLGDVALAAERALVGRVVGADGSGVRGAWIEARGADLDFANRAPCDADGWFRLRRLPPGDVEVETSAPGRATTFVRATTGRAEPVVVTLTRGGRLVVHAETAAGDALGGAALVVVAGDGHARTKLALDAFGEFALRLPPGRARVEVAGAAPMEADVRETATTTVRVRSTK